MLDMVIDQMGSDWTKQAQWVVFHAFNKAKVVLATAVGHSQLLLSVRFRINPPLFFRTK